MGFQENLFSRKELAIVIGISTIAAVVLFISYVTVR